MKQFVIPASVQKAIDILESRGFEAFLVGGSVRDYLLGKEPVDMDICTNALPEQVREVFEWKGHRVIDTGLKYGTVTVLIKEDSKEENSPYSSIEITTYRIDSDYTDNRRPDNVEFTGVLSEDLARRDFTVNAMAYGNQRGIVDPYGGQEDLEKGIIRCVGEPEQRFREDTLRILRALRFASVLDFSIDEATYKAMLSQKEALRHVSEERIASELMKLLCGKAVKSILTEYIDVLAVPLPELAPMKGFDQNNPHHIYDLLMHTAASVEAIPPIPHLRLAMLLHDVGKVKTYTEDAKGIGHFYGHQSVSVEIAKEILKRLKLDNNTVEKVIPLIKYHDSTIEANKKSVKKWLGKLTPEIFFDLLEVKRADSMAQSPHYAGRRKILPELRALAEEVLRDKECFSLKTLDINGGDLIALGFREGKEIGLILQRLLDGVIDGRLENTYEALSREALSILVNLE